MRQVDEMFCARVPGPCGRAHGAPVGDLVDLVDGGGLDFHGDHEVPHEAVEDQRLAVLVHGADVLGVGDDVDRLPAQSECVRLMGTVGPSPGIAIQFF